MQSDFIDLYRIGRKQSILLSSRQTQFSFHFDRCDNKENENDNDYAIDTIKISVKLNSAVFNEFC